MLKYVYLSEEARQKYMHVKGFLIDVYESLFLYCSISFYLDVPLTLLQFKAQIRNLGSTDIFRNKTIMVGREIL